MGDNPLLKLEAAGTSVWLDLISRELLESGRLAALIAEDGVTGLTSNPSIFEKAIGSGKGYAEALAKLARDGRNLPEIYSALVYRDIREAAALLEPVHRRTGGRDGWVSLEVSPLLAARAAETVAEARRRASELALPNLMIKVPATPEGLIAIEELIYDGLCVNATLIFSPEQYRQVALAHRRGLLRRQREGRPLDPGQASVASFFISRLDTAADRRMAQLPGGAALRGQMAIATARRAYHIQQELLAEGEWQALARAGAQPQRLLWASTSTKDPSYPDVLYIEGLVGPGTVNTIPLPTLEAFRDHGRVQVNLPGDDGVLNALAKMGIEVETIGAELLAEGVRAFEHSYRQLLGELSRAATAENSFFSLGGAAPAAQAAWAELQEKKVVERLWAKDGTPWGLKEAAGQDYLGWLDLPDWPASRRAELAALAGELKDAGLGRVVLLGMGGSSLGATALTRIKGEGRLVVLDSTVPETVKAALDGAAESLFIVASKSGTTGEIRSFFAAAWEAVQRVRGERAGDHFVAITDPGTELATLARERGFRRLYENPPELGGRYSVLSYFGLVAGALDGVSLDELAKGAATAAQAAKAPDGVVAELGAVLGGLGRTGRDKVTLVMPAELESFGAWTEQLLAESTGKEGRGLVPVAAEPLGSPEVYGEDRLFVGMGEPAAAEDRLLDLMEAGLPVWRSPDLGAFGLGGLFFTWEVATALAGALIGINAFDQPDVERAKVATRRILAGETSAAAPPVLAEGRLFRLEGVGEPGALAENLGRLLAELEPGRYLALQAFLTPSPAFDRLFTALRQLLRDSRRVATTFGYGPRYLHSTGQIHKGGPKSGVFWQFEAADRVEVGIPGEDYGFGKLKRAQALGDLATLQAAGRPVHRFWLGEEPTAALEELRGLLASLLKG